MEHTKQSSGLQIVCCIIVYFLPDPFPLIVRHNKDTTDQPAAALLISSSVSYPVLPLARREMLLHDLLARLFGAFFFPLQGYFISQCDFYYFDEMPTTKIRQSSLEISLWETEHIAQSPSCSLVYHDQGHSKALRGGYKSSLSLSSSAHMSHSCELTERPSEPLAGTGGQQITQHSFCDCASQRSVFVILL